MEQYVYLKDIAKNIYESEHQKDKDLPYYDEMAKEGCRDIQKKRFNRLLRQFHLYDELSERLKDRKKRFKYMIPIENADFLEYLLSSDTIKKFNKLMKNKKKHLHLRPKK